MIRGLGPSLAQFHISNVLADPLIELHKPGGGVVTNDDWRSTQSVDIQGTGIPPPNGVESAILATLAPGAYTAIMRGKSGATGVGLVEVYDLSMGSNSDLSNISTRGFVGKRDDVLIGGFILSGSTGSAKVVVRALGPSLVRRGVSNPVGDPMLELRDANGALVVADDNWNDSQGVELQSIALAPFDTREAATTSLLTPGAYTAIVRGKNQQTGVGLIEIYCLR